MMKIIVQNDGGAARGLIELIGMHHIEQKVGIDFRKIAALFSGTSTGSLVCGCIAAGVSVFNLLITYTKYIPLLFKGRKFFNPRRWSKGVFDRKPFLKVINETLDKYAVKDNKKGRKLKDLVKPYMSTAYDLVEERTMFFKSMMAKDAYLDLVDVMSWSALSAANYFGAIDAVIREVWHRFQDGGQGIKNCTLLDCIDECEMSHKGISIRKLGSGAYLDR
jgi:patatin-like phospholipase/acyl hydrolase